MISRLSCAEAGHGALRAINREDAYALHLVLRPVDVDFRLGGRDVPNEGNEAGGLYLLDLQATTLVDFRSAFDVVRFYITRQSLDDLAEEGSLAPVAGLMRPPLGARDEILHSLALAMLPALARPDEANSLFIDHVTRAFHAHVTRTYGGAARESDGRRQALACWQARVATELMDSRLDGKVSVRDLAVACNLSISHFSRAFVQTFGMPPHRWLIARRIDHAKALIRSGSLPLAQIATASGFATQSHFTRVFTSVVGASPSRWGRLSNPHAAPGLPRRGV
ncbi:AraC-type DNA-binding protein [Luteibacter sp. UNCMF331Sha3.1]|uniref:helix-turn-helix transcriptional regulator n=1 Tax=Luteibacter sp. UNCMF331Sha3.1 TaxID=1502760 RepID=UPI0008D6E7F1|nr:AraC family transcriptional regulator [Luteibacter sp. UNCMF331Sha3.1]SEN11125.1 AraC-type DNA-binding protein [Luteibacter sp. UNCMF331Sha3.1]